MSDGIKIVSSKMEQEEISKAQQYTPSKPGLGKNHEDQGEYCCPFNGSYYRLDKEGPAYYWNQSGKGEKTKEGNMSVALANGVFCQRWVDKDYPLFFKSADHAIESVKQWIKIGDYNKIARLSDLTSDPMVAKFLLNNKDVVIKAIYEAETNTLATAEEREHTANYTWETFRSVDLQEVAEGDQK